MFKNEKKKFFRKKTNLLITLQRSEPKNEFPVLVKKKRKGHYLRSEGKPLKWTKFDKLAVECRKKNLIGNKTLLKKVF